MNGGRQGRVARFGCLLVLGSALFVKSADAQGDDPVVRYFRAFDTIEMPMRPYREISAKEAQASEAYFEAEYDELNRLSEVEKVRHGEVDLRYRFRYYDSGVLREISKQQLKPEVRP